MGFESFHSSPENKAPDPAVVAAAENIIGPPPLANPAMFETGPKFNYTPPVAEVVPPQDPALNEQARNVHITTIIAQPPK